MKKMLLILLSVSLIISCSSSPGSNDFQQKKIKPKVILTSAQLEKLGFEKFEAKFFLMYLLKDGFILGNVKDNNIIRYKSPDDIRQYRAKGEGPAHFLRVLNIFKYDEQTIGVFDNLKNSVLLFDLDLNYMRELRVNPFFQRISSLKGDRQFIALGLFKKKVFALLDQDFKIKEKFIDKNTTSRLPQMYSVILNHGYFLNESKFVFTRRYYDEKECHADIYDVDTRKVILTLRWEQDRRPTKQDRLKLENNYYSKYVFEFEDYFVMTNLFVKNLGAIDKYDLIIFNKKGEIKYRDKNFPYYPIEIFNNPKSRLYFITDNEDLAYIELKDLVD